MINYYFTILQKGDIIKTLTKILIATTSCYFGLFSLGQIYECFLYWQVIFSIFHQTFFYKHQNRIFAFNNSHL